MSGVVRSTGLAVVSVAAAIVTAFAVASCSEATMGLDAGGPAQVTDLRLAAAGTRDVSIAFTQVDDGSGQPARYHIRIGSGAAASWSQMTAVSAGTCSGVVAGTAAGQTHTCSVTGLSPASSYVVQLVAYRGSMGDGTAVFGPLSNALTVSTQAAGGGATVTIAPRSVSLDRVGATHQFTAEARDASGNPVSNPGFSWTSTNAGVATVSTSGRATVTGIGTALIVVSTACCGTDTARLAVEPVAGGNTVFQSRWNAGVGNSDHFISDGGAWNNYDFCWQSRNNVLNVVAGSTVGWTGTANVLRIQQRGNTECGNVENTTALPASTTHWGRFYFRNDETRNMHWHPVTYNAVGRIQLVPWMRVGTTRGVVIGIGAGTTYPTNLFFAGTRKSGETRDYLPHGTWFRYEWMVEYVTPTSVRIWPRIYNMAGQLLYDASSFYQNDHPQSGSHSLQSWYAAGNTIAITDPQLARRFGVGNEGPGASNASMESWYIADVALSVAGWIGL